MRVLVAPDSFTGSMSAAEAARAIRDGWQATAPDDAVALLPVSDGGPGFVAAMAAAVGGELLEVATTGPWGAAVSAQVLLVHAADGTTAYIEVAQAAGGAGSPRGSALAASSAGVGPLLRAAVAAGARRLVAGLGGTLVTDGGAGMLADLGATATDGAGRDCTARLRAGAASLADVASVDLAPARALLSDVELIIATDVDNPLLGARGSAQGFGPQKGLTGIDVAAAEDSLRALAHACGRTSDGRSPAVALGSGAAGGLGFALLHLGGRIESGIELVLQAVGFADQVAGSDLVVTGEGTLDWQSLHGKVIAGVCRAALDQGRPVLVLAGGIAVGRREWMAIGVSGAYAIVDTTTSDSEVEAAIARGPDLLAGLAARAARTWSH